MSDASYRPIKARKMDFDFDPETVPKWWFNNNPVLTHAANGLHLVFPEGERFFIRSVRHYEDRIQDPVLKAQIRGFYAQEARHGSEHTRSFEMFRQQGYDMSDWLENYRRRVAQLERWAPPIVRLSVTVALEHLTATLGDNALTDPYLETMHPTMRDLLKWHAAEEIEHKAVAFDVFTAVGGSYPTRMLGMALGLGLLMHFWGRGMRRLFAIENLSRQKFVAYRDQLHHERPGHLRKLMRRALLEYMKPGFHPSDRDNYAMATRYLDAAKTSSASS
ncbi:MAG: metal-dependent hydrolase [Myxococcota bacterium]